MATKKADLFMGSTEIEAARSAGEITALLVRVGAKQIATDYDQGKIAGLRFVLNVVKASEVFFPYVTVDASGQTLFEKFETSGLKLLSAPTTQ